MTVTSTISATQDVVIEASDSSFVPITTFFFVMSFHYIWLCMMQSSSIWAKPNSENFRQCIDTSSHKSKLIFKYSVCYTELMFLFAIVSFLSLINSTPSLKRNFLSVVF